MIVKLCDFCLIEGKMRENKWRFRVRDGRIGTTLHICVDHKESARGKSIDDCNEIIVKADEGLKKINSKGGK